MQKVLQESRTFYMYINRKLQNRILFYTDMFNE